MGLGGRPDCGLVGLTSCCEFSPRLLILLWILNLGFGAGTSGLETLPGMWREGGGVGLLGGAAGLLRGGLGEAWRSRCSCTPTNPV